MASLIGTVVNILALVGVLFIVGIIIFYIYKYFKKQNKKDVISQIYPPGEYMQNVGIKCPDYWVYLGTTPDGKYVCQNKFNIPVVPKNNYSCSQNNQVSFDAIEAKRTWEFGNPNDLKTYTDKEKSAFLNNSNRCNWVNNCGSAEGLSAVWTGVSDICNNPGGKSVGK
jgi:hypothetical protein